MCAGVLWRGGLVAKQERRGIYVEWANFPCGIGQTCTTNLWNFMCGIGRGPKWIRLRPKPIGMPNI